MLQEQQMIRLEDDEKITPVMLYTQGKLIWGDVVTKSAIRVSTWLRTQAIPRYIFVHNAQILSFDSGGTPKPQSFDQLHIPSCKVIAIHIKPPDRDPLDYDPNEPMRSMTPASALVGAFRFDGFLRMSTQTTIERFLDVAKEDFTSIYDLEIRQPSFPQMGVIRAPMALIRSLDVLFSPREC